MTHTINERNLSLAWLGAMEHLFDHEGIDTNLVATITDVSEENIKIREELDSFIAARKASGKDKDKGMTTATIANTIFPEALYIPKLGDRARQHLYDTYEQAYPVIERIRANRDGTYFYRMMHWSPKDGKKQEINQIERVITTLRRELAKPNTLSSIYEVGICGVTDGFAKDLSIVPPGGDIRIQDPDQAVHSRGFPCLSHISLTYTRGRLHLTALYRNQHFIHKAYGNYLGLCRLLNFICREAGCEPGELVCIATHADAELPSNKRAIASLIQRCRNVVNEVQWM